MIDPIPMAITMGDASGVGPEIVLRRHAARPFGDDVVVYGDLAVLRRGAQLLGADVDLVAVDPARLGASSPSPGALRVIDLGLLTAEQHRPGVLDGPSGAAARAYVVAATDDALAGRVAGIVTMPMNKEATQLVDPGFVGHTELVAERCGATRVTMMLTNGPLAVTHVSTHCSLRQAIDRVRPERVLDVIELTHATLRRFLPVPRIAVCGLNPHAGEHGLFGDEDLVHIVPAIERARALGIDATGPHPADTVFHQAVHRHRYDAIVCMYHDQGHGPMKLLAFDTGVNVTLGLPIIRTSVDHGTAFDIAWQGVAFTDSLDHALAYAWRLAGRVQDGVEVAG
jgi:4-hydroxythreonine-4-phosphate dehydrogenase